MTCLVGLSLTSLWETKQRTLWVAFQRMGLPASASKVPVAVAAAPADAVAGYEAALEANGWTVEGSGGDDRLVGGQRAVDRRHAGGGRPPD